MSFGEYVPSAFFTITLRFSRVEETWTRSLAEYKSTSVKWSRSRLIVEVKA
jgi:hypothetical protein